MARVLILQRIILPRIVVLLITRNYNLNTYYGVGKKSTELFSTINILIWFKMLYDPIKVIYRNINLGRKKILNNQ